MNYTPETVARKLDMNSAGDRRNFITAEIVAEVIETRKDTYGSYLVCGWPSMEQQRQIHNLALRRQYGVPCPEPREAFGYPDVLDFDSNDPRVAEHAARSGSRNGFDLDIEGGWHGFTVWGRAYAAGIDFGRFFRLDDPRPILEADDAGYDDDGECLGHPAGPFDPMGETVYCDGSCRSI